MTLTLSAYQSAAQATAIYPRPRAIEYVALGLASEAGEVAGKIKKVLRDKDAAFDEDDKAGLAAELGDVLWYVAQLATELGLDLNDVAAGNIAKLQARKARGTIAGSGDQR